MDGSGGNGFVACGFDRIGERVFACRSPSISRIGMIGLAYGVGDSMRAIRKPNGGKT